MSEKLPEETIPLSTLVVMLEASERVVRKDVARSLYALRDQYNADSSHGKAVRAVLVRLAEQLIAGVQFEACNEQAQEAFNRMLMRAERAERQERISP